MNRRDFLGRSLAAFASALPRVEPIFVGIPDYRFNASYAEQESPHWCWAASIQMVLDYYGVVVLQEQIVGRSFGLDPRGRLPDFSVSSRLITANLNGSSVDLTGRRYQVQAKFSEGLPRARVLLDELDAYSPVLLAYRNRANSGHVVVVTGAWYVPTFDGPIIESVVVRDPWPSPENRWNLGRVELPGTDLTSQMTAHWLVRVR